MSGKIAGDFDSLVFPKICTGNVVLKVLVNLGNYLANKKDTTT